MEQTIQSIDEEYVIEITSDTKNLLGIEIKKEGKYVSSIIFNKNEDKITGTYNKNK